MYVQVRLIDTGKTVSFDVSRKESITNLKNLIEKQFKIKPDAQRLFYSGKQLENNYTLFDYGVKLNNVIQLMIRATIAENGSKKKSLLKKNTKNTKNKQQEEPSTSSATSSSSDEHLDDTSEESKYFKVGDYVDVKDYNYGSWFIGKLLKIKKDPSPIVKPHDSNSPVQNDGLIYVVEYFLASEEPAAEVQLQEIRPHASEIVPLNMLKPGDKVLMNYNADYPQERGYWYDVLVKEVKTNRRGQEVIGNVTVGPNSVLKNCHLRFVDDIYSLKPYKLLVNRTPEDDKIMQTEPDMRAGPLYCITCKDKLNKSCKDCGCHVCGGKDNEDKQLMCDECNHPYHMACLNPPLEVIPEGDDWYCPSCKNDENEIVKAGEKLKASKKKTPESTSTSKRDWGKGMACVGRTKICKIVPPNHFGPIPGVEVGTTWEYRLQASEAGVHRPPVGGIHGRDNEGAFSIVLSGGYEDDVDNGEEFLYTGSGGRDLSGNKRTALQSYDQKLTRYNRALALNCDENLDNVKGATAKDWKNGKPVRVIRTSKLSKHSDYAPKEGVRYDGIYKVVKYYPERGISGFKVWRFVLRRDDPTPAPWTPKGIKRMAELGLQNIIYSLKSADKSTKSKSKRTLKDANNKKSKTNDLESDSSDDIDRKNKMIKIRYDLETELKDLIAADVKNKNYWIDCKELLEKGKKAFLERVEETFLCICCQEIVFDPITTKCSHNICKNCLKRSFSAQVFNCPTCRTELDKNSNISVNEKLAKALLFLFPGYNTDR